MNALRQFGRFVRAVKRACAHVLARNVADTANAFAPTGPSALRVRRKSASDASVLSVPTTEKLTIDRPKSSSSGGRAVVPRSTRPRPWRNVHAMRTVPARSSSAVRMTLHAAVGVVDPVDRHLVDPRPLRSARRSNSVSKNHPSSTNRREELVRDLRPDRLEPTLRVADPCGEGRRGGGGCTNGRRARASGAAATDESGVSRDPVARSLCPETSGATSGSSAARSVERSTSMYASTCASLVLHAARRARPRPLRVEMLGPDRPEAPRQPGRAQPRAVGRGVVDDRDLPAERERRREVRVEPGDARLERGLLVVDGHHDVDNRNVDGRDVDLFDLSHARTVVALPQRRAGTV